MNRRGFTLLEVVVATALLGIGVGVAMQVFSGGLKNIQRIDMAHRAMNHAENVMNEILSDQSITGPTEISTGTSSPTSECIVATSRTRSRQPRTRVQRCTHSASR